MTGFRTFGPGEKKDDFGAAVGIGRSMAGRTLLLAEETTVELHSESAGEAGISERKKNRLVNNWRMTSLAEKRWSVDPGQ